MARSGELVDVLVSEIRYQRLAQHPYTASVHVEGRPERWPISRDDIQALAAEVERLRAEAGEHPSRINLWEPFRWTLERPTDEALARVRAADAERFDAARI